MSVRIIAGGQNSREVITKVKAVVYSCLLPYRERMQERLVHALDRMFGAGEHSTRVIQTPHPIEIKYFVRIGVRDLGYIVLDARWRNNLTLTPVMDSSDIKLELPDIKLELPDIKLEPVIKSEGDVVVGSENLT